MSRRRNDPEWWHEVRSQFVGWREQDGRTIRSEARRIGVTERTLRLYLNGRPPKRLQAATATKFRVAGYRLSRAAVADETALGAVGLSAAVRAQLPETAREIVEHPKYILNLQELLRERAAYLAQLRRLYPQERPERLLDKMLDTRTSGGTVATGWSDPQAS